MRTLDEILQEYFGCKGKAFLKTPRKINEDSYEYFTKSGAKAYEKLCFLLDDLQNLGVIEDAEDIVEQLDSIVRDE